MCFGAFVWVIVFFKQKTAYEMRISDWSSDVCSSDLHIRKGPAGDCRAFFMRAAPRNAGGRRSFFFDNQESSDERRYDRQEGDERQGGNARRSRCGRKRSRRARARRRAGRIDRPPPRAQSREQGGAARYRARPVDGRVGPAPGAARSEEPPAGKEGASTWRSRGAP